MKNIFKKKNKNENYIKFFGYSGLFPFLLILIFSTLNKENINFYSRMMVFYLSVIITFIGATYWGVALNLKKNNFFLILFSIFPTIIATIIYALDISFSFKLFLGIILLNLILIYEKVYLMNHLNDWYLNFRKKLNLLVSALVLIFIIVINHHKGFF